MWDSALFVRKSDSLPIPDQTKLTKEIPLMANPALAAAAEAIGAGAGSAGQGLQISSFLLMFCMNYGANYILG